MSGGSYNYLYCKDTSDLVERLMSLRTEDFDNMLDRLRYSYPDSRIVADMVKFQTEIEDLLAVVDPKVHAFSEIWKAVEWVDSGDWSEDKVVEAVQNNDQAHALPDPDPGPWQNLDEIPAEVAEVHDIGKNLWRRSGGNWEWKTSDGRWFTVYNPRAVNYLAPFVRVDGTAE